MSIAREIPSGRYLHQTRAFRVALLECMDDSYPYGDHATSWDYDKTYFQPRREALLAASQNIPPGWRLEECVVPIVGGGHVVRLAALFKPTDKGFRGVYCVEEYRWVLSPHGLPERALTGHPQLTLIPLAVEHAILND